MDWRVGTRRGPISESVGILGRVGDKLTDVRQVRLKADVMPEFEYEPRRAVFERGTAASVTVQFRPLRAKSVAVIGATSNQAGVTARVFAERSVVEIVYDPNVPEHGELGIRVIVTTDNPTEPRVEIPVGIQAQAEKSNLPATMPSRGGN